MRVCCRHLQELLCCRRESHADALQEKSADQMSMMYIQTVEAELRKFRCCSTPPIKAVSQQQCNQTNVCVAIWRMSDWPTVYLAAVSA